ncbi:hypothetical protein [Leucobacter denitrificans]|uniref:DNA polymerase III subunit gamma/tau n=1 Tax=Leucobacter denitrificans TaxID=683042 RepID=A0A7G9S4N9_9MICO|nr:hypothetical protein [Leucobacter denitrificans]QNN62814.1 hypothetical protein H9L06_11510 [Leucobacter denitrificans]
MRSGTGDERESATHSGWTVEGRGPDAEQQPTVDPPIEIVADEAAELTSTEEPTEKSGQMSNLTVVMLGIVGGISLLYAWIWMSWAQYYSVVNAAVAAGSGSIGGVLQQIVFWIAPLAPILWFICALATVRNDQRKLTVALLIGLIVTFPLPMVFSSGAAL